VPIEVLRLDDEVLPRDIRVRGCLKDSHNAPIAGRTVHLVPMFGDAQFGKVVYPAVKTREDGRFEFDGVTPEGRYTIAYERLDGSFGVYAVHRGVLGVKDYLLSINDFSTNSAAQALTLEQMVFESQKGKRLSLEDFKGKVVVVDFWASWCSPCIRDMPKFLSLAERLKGQERIVFLAVSVDSERVLWERMLAENPWQEVQHAWFDPVANHRRFDIAIPYKVIYDASGRIIEKGHDLDLAKILAEQMAVKGNGR
jgi:thiol-disulfide isomerase/thioredoxin